MLTRPIPSTQEPLPVIGLGTWSVFDTGNTEAERIPLREVLKDLVNSGGAVIDSSPMYGKSEGVIGDLVTQTGLRPKVFLATKVWTHGREAGILQMLQSFRLMKTEVMDLMQIHNLVDWKIHVPVLKEWKEEGKIRYTGITHYNSGSYDTIEQVLKQESFDFLQINYSIAEPEAEERLFPLAAEKGTAILVNRPFKTGSLFYAVKDRKLPDFAAEFDCDNWASFFLKFILAHPAITCIIPATSNPSHLQEYIKAGSGRLPDEALRKKMKEFLQSL